MINDRVINASREVTRRLYFQISELLIKASEKYIKNLGINKNNLDMDAINGIVLSELSDERLDTNQPDSYYYDLVKDRFDEEYLKLKMLDELSKKIHNKSPYNKVETRYCWMSAGDNIESLSELQKYIDEEDIESFVNKYAPDWEEWIDDPLIKWFDDEN